MTDLKNYKVPRRCRIDLHSPAEKAILDAMQVVEGMEAHEKLTEAAVLLQQALDRVSDYVDESLGVGMIN